MKIKFILLSVLLLLMFSSVSVSASVSGEDPIDWKTAISTNITDRFLDNMFVEEEYEPKIMYVTTPLNLRVFPNVEGTEVITVLKVNTELTVLAEYHGWSRVLYEDSGVEYKYYVWNKYLSDEKVVNNYLGNFKLTAYCKCSKCCGKWSGSPTASGAWPSEGRTVAMGGVPFGTKLLINGHVYTVEDRGTPYGHVDIYFDNHSDANAFGRKYAEVYKVI